MIPITTLRELALSFPETTEAPHFDKIAFKVKQKIFATYDPDLQRACIKLSETDQHVFSIANPAVIFPVPNKWGKQGWTLIELNQVKPQVLADAITTAYCTVAPKKLAEPFRPVTDL